MVCSIACCVAGGSARHTRTSLESNDPRWPARTILVVGGGGGMSVAFVGISLVGTCVLTCTQTSSHTDMRSVTNSRVYSLVSVHQRQSTLDELTIVAQRGGWMAARRCCIRPFGGLELPLDPAHRDLLRLDVSTRNNIEERFQCTKRQSEESSNGKQTGD